MTPKDRRQHKDQIGARLRQVRERQGFTRRVTAGKLGVAESTLQRWEDGTAELGVLDAIGLARLYGLPLIDLLGELAMPATAPNELGPADLAQLLRLVAAQESAAQQFRRHASPALRRALDAERQEHNTEREQ